MAWADLPADPAYEPVALPHAAPDPSLPACDHDQLVASLADGGSGMGMGSGRTVITVQRTSGAACKVHDDVLSLSGVLPNGSREQLPLTAEPYMVLEPADLRAGTDRAVVLLGYSTRCPHALPGASGTTISSHPPRPTLHDLVLTLRHGSALRLGSGDEAAIGCVGDTVDVSSAGAAAYEPSYPPIGLTATMTAPSTAVAGQTLNYVVALRNTTDAPFPMSRCVNYAQFFKVLPYVPGDHALNCAAGHDIPAGGTESFRMRITVPPDAQPVRGVLIWHMHTGGPESVVACALVNISATASAAASD